MSLNNIYTGPSTPSGVALPPAPTTGYTVRLDPANFAFSGTGQTVGNEYIVGDYYLQANTYLYGGYTVFYGQPINCQSYKIGVGHLSSSLVRVMPQPYYFPKLNNDNSSLYYYYDSLTGNIYKNGNAIYVTTPNLTNVGFCVDQNFNVYMMPTSSTCYLLGDLSQYYNNNNIQLTSLFGMMYKPSVNAPNALFILDQTVSMYITPTLYPYDSIYNNLLYDPSLGKYKNVVTTSSSSPTLYKYLEFSGLAIFPYADRRVMIKSTVAPSDIIVAFGRFGSTILNPGSEYTLSYLQSTSSIWSSGLISYVQSAQAFFTDTVNSYVFNLNLNVNGSTAIFDLVTPSTLRAGSNISSEQNISVNLGGNNWQSFPICGVFVATSSPSTNCTIEIITPN